MFSIRCSWTDFWCAEYATWAEQTFQIWVKIHYPDNNPECHYVFDQMTFPLLWMQRGGFLKLINEISFSVKRTWKYRDSKNYQDSKLCKGWREIGQPEAELMSISSAPSIPLTSFWASFATSFAAFISSSQSVTQMASLPLGNLSSKSPQSTWIPHPSLPSSASLV